MIISPHSSASVERIFSQLNCTKSRTTNFLKAETLKIRLLAGLSRERIRHAPVGNQTKKTVTNVLDGTVSKRYKERLKIQKYEPSTYCGNENEEELIETCD